MMTNPKSTKDAPPESPAREMPPASETAPFNAMTDLFYKGMERWAGMQKHVMDVVVMQSVDALNAWKKAAGVSSNAPGATLFDLAGQGLEKVSHTQKTMIDFMVDQGTHTCEMAKQRRDYLSKVANSATEMMSQATERAIAVQKSMLDLAAEQQKAVASVIRRQAVMTGSGPAVEVVDTLQRNVDVALQAQKDFMDAAAKPLKAAAATHAA